MTTGWNFERRRDTCARFLLGVSLLTKGLAERDTNLEAVRHRARLSPEEALFAARRLDEEGLITFEPGGAIRSKEKGIARAETTRSAVRAKASRFSDVKKLLEAGGPPLALLALVIREEPGETLACGSPDEEMDASYRLALHGEEIIFERRAESGEFTRIE